VRLQALVEVEDDVARHGVHVPLRSLQLVGQEVVDLVLDRRLELLLDLRLVQDLLDVLDREEVIVHRLADAPRELLPPLRSR